MPMMHASIARASPVETDANGCQSNPTLKTDPRRNEATAAERKVRRAMRPCCPPPRGPSAPRGIHREPTDQQPPAGENDQEYDHGGDAGRRECCFEPNRQRETRHTKTDGRHSIAGSVACNSVLAHRIADRGEASRHQVKIEQAADHSGQAHERHNSRDRCDVIGHAAERLPAAQWWCRHISINAVRRRRHARPK